MGAPLVDSSRTFVVKATRTKTKKLLYLAKIGISNGACALAEHAKRRTPGLEKSIPVGTTEQVALATNGFDALGIFGIISQPATQPGNAHVN